MRTLRHSKWLYFNVGIAAVVTALALTLTFMDWNRFKGPIERSASARFGRKVTIDGPLSVHLWSRIPTVTVVGLTLDNPPWEPDRPMAHIDRLQIQLELGALLRGHVVLHRVELVRPELYLHQEKSGRANWTFENQAPSNARASGPTKLPAIRDLQIESGRLELIDELRRLKVKGTVEAHERSSREDARPFHLEGKGSINGKPFKVDVTGGALRGLSPNRPYPFSLAIRAGENEIQADGRMMKPFDLGALELQVSAHGRDLAELFFLTQITLPNSPPFELQAHLTRDGTQFAVDHIEGKLGESDVSGTVDIDASRKRPDVKARLVSHHLFMKDFAAITGNRAAPPASSLASTSGKPPPPAAPPPPSPLFPDARLQVDRVRAVDADVHFQATSIEAGSLPLTKVALHATLREGLLTLEPLEFDLPEGQFKSWIQIDARQETPEVNIDLRANDIHLDQLKGKDPNAAPPLDGVMQAHAVIQGMGDSVHAVMADANGAVTLVVPSGDVRRAFAELTGVDVAEGLGLLMGKSGEQTPVRCGVVEFDVQGGTAHAQNLVFDTKNVLITGGGQIYLGPERLDLTIQGQPKKVRLVRLRAPVEIKGTLSKPAFRLETGHLLKQGGIAAALGTLLSPLAAVLAFVDPGLAKDQNCAQLLAEAHADTHLATGSPGEAPPLPEKQPDGHPMRTP